MQKLFYETVPLRYSSDTDSLYGLLVAAAVLSLAACPFTILLNALVMVAVKTKRRLQTHPNILLACLALTDLMVGLVVQPLHITKTIFLLQGNEFHDFCDIDLAFTFFFIISCFASFFHLFLISGERYLAVKHGFSHANAVTKTRLVFFSAVAWIAAVFSIFVASYSKVVAFGFITATFSSFIVLQILVYKEARRHEQHILSLQVSEEARAKFKKEMKALKVTTIILVTLFLCFFLPLFIIFVTWQIFTNISPDVKTSFCHFSLLPTMINSVLNPVIYTVRKREFRVAFIELILKKNLQEAEEFDLRLFRSTINAVRQQDGQEGGEQEQNAEERNQVHANDNQEASGSNFHDNIDFASQNELVSSNALNSTSMKKTEEQHGERRNPAHVNGSLQDNSRSLTSGANFDGNANLPSQNEHISSNEFNSAPKNTEVHVENDEGRNPTRANSKREYNSEVIASGANHLDDDNTNLASENVAVLSNALLNNTSEKTEEQHDEE